VSTEERNVVPLQLPGNVVPLRPEVLGSATTRLPARPRKPRLADREPEVAARREIVLSHWRTLTGQRPHGGTLKQVEPLVREYSAQDIIGTINALWWELDRWDRLTGFWQQGNMSWAAIGNRIEAFKAGRLRYRRDPSKEAPRRT
jgi:hypothetical protein